jgi:N-acetylglucosamine PTS system EIICBA or EIICB component
VVCYLVIGNAAQVFLAVPPATIPPGTGEAIGATLSAAWKAATIDKLQVPVGIVAGLVGGGCYNRFSTTRLPDYLAFFGGRRLVPIVAGIAGLAIAILLGPAYDWISAGIDGLSRGVVASGGWGLFAFGVLNRLLIVTGLHHILNNIAYFVVGEYAGKTGDLTRFFAGDPSAGAFMSGFFPVMMFGLPAACLAMYHTAAPERRKAVGGMLLSLALTSFLTGVTEPIEFSFMFLAPALYAAHAVLTGIAHVAMHLLGVKLGYGFSAGLFDYVLNYGRATHPLLLLPIGLAYAAIYYGLFRWAILKFDLKTPGREAVQDGSPATAAAPAGDRAGAIVAALGGAGNLRTIDACTTRLRLRIGDMSVLDEPGLRALGARGILKLADNNLQVVVGGIADTLAMEMRDFVGRSVAGAALPPDMQAESPLPAAIVAALGGAANLVDSLHRPGRIRIVVHDPEIVDRQALAANARAVIMPAATTFHLLVVD